MLYETIVNKIQRNESGIPPKTNITEYLKKFLCAARLQKGFLDQYNSKEQYVLTNSMQCHKLSKNVSAIELRDSIDRVEIESYL